MRKIIEKVKGLILVLPEPMIVAGTGLFTSSIFNFDYRGDSSLYDRVFGQINFYYYKDVTLFKIAIGAMLIITGVLLLQRRKKEKNKGLGN